MVVGLSEIRIGRQKSMSPAPRPLTALKSMHEALGDRKKNAQYAQLISFTFLASMRFMCKDKVRNRAKNIQTAGLLTKARAT